MLIGLSGLKGSGKDTVGAYLVKEHGFERRSFADKLKESAAALFDIEVWQLEEFKNDSNMFIGIQRDEGVDEWGWRTVREFLQRYGSEAHTDIFGDDFWADQVLPVGGFYAGRAIVVTDARRRSEIDRILTLSGHIVYVDRPALDQKDPHRTEVEMEYSARVGYRLKNDRGMMELYDNIEKMLEDLA